MQSIVITTRLVLRRDLRQLAKSKYLAPVLFFFLFSLGAVLLRRDLFFPLATFPSSPASSIGQVSAIAKMSAITTQTYAQRAAKHVNPTAKRLLAIMERKQSNLCVSVDVTTAQEALEVVRRVGKSVCMVKVRYSCS